MKLHDHICEGCKIPFKHVRNDARFHSQDCARQHNVKTRPKTNPKVHQLKCGKKTAPKLYACAGHLGGASVPTRRIFT